MKTLDMREARLYGEKEIDEITKPDLDKIQCGSCVHKGAFFECPQYGDEDGLIPDDIAYHGAVCPHYQPKK